MLCWEWNRAKEDGPERMFPGSATTQLQEWASPQLRESLLSGKAPTNVWWEVFSSQGFQDLHESQCDGISGIYLLVASLSCTLFTNLYSCNISPLQTNKISRFSKKSQVFWKHAKTRFHKISQDQISEKKGPKITLVVYEVGIIYIPQKLRLSL